ncbi:hypothetical protein DXC12_08705 [Melissococcus sp. OM08-11BH]|nr:hypothetical protein DXC12_08705 [Melissococcus sp. OM08-11BH]
MRKLSTTNNDIWSPSLNNLLLLDGLNNKIKVIKRVTYGYRNFLLFKRPIFLIQDQVFQVK